MAHDHQGSGRSHDHTAGANAKMLVWALALISTYLIVEVIGGFVFNSLALLSDAAHMLTDVAALVIALLAIKMGKKAPDDKRTFGYRRFEILAAAFNAVLLFLIAIYVFVEAIMLPLHRHDRAASRKDAFAQPPRQPFAETGRVMVFRQSTQRCAARERFQRVQFVDPGQSIARRKP